MKFYFLKIIFLLLLVCGCNKHKELPRCKEMRHAPQEFLDYWFISAGSWYVYKLDTIAEIYDTVKINSLSISDDQHPDYNEYRALCATQYDLTLFHSNPKYFRHTDSTVLDKAGSDWFYSDFSGRWALYHGSSIGNIKSYNLMYAFPNISNEVHGWNQFVGIDSLVTPIGKFDSVIFMRSNFPRESSSNKSKFYKEMYLAKNVGIVKITYTNGEVWDLVKYHINQ